MLAMRLATMVVIPAKGDMICLSKEIEDRVLGNNHRTIEIARRLRMRGSAWKRKSGIMHLRQHGRGRRTTIEVERRKGRRVRKGGVGA